MTLERRLVRVAAACALLLALPTVAHAVVMTPIDTETSSVSAPTWLAVSPAGDSLYVVNGNGTVSVYDVAAGVLTLTQSVSGGGLCGNNSQLNNATSVVVSPDGHHVYVTSSTNPNRGNRITAWDRDYTNPPPQRGEITCKQNLLDNANLRKASGLSISPDGVTVYATSTTRKQERVSAYARNPTTGLLTFLQSVKDDATLRINQPRATAVSPDDKHVYVAAVGDDAVTKFDRNAAGSLSNSAFQSFTDPTHLVVGADGKNVYAISPGQTRIRVYDRNAGTGALTLDGDLISSSLAGTQGGVAVSPDGAWVFGAANNVTTGNALVVLSRDAGTGSLAMVTSIAITGGGTRFVVASPDSKCVFVAAESDNSVRSYCFDNSRDYGDALRPSTSPTTYPTLEANAGASHSLDAGVQLGAGTPDGEANGQPTLGADGDDTDLNGDDENGSVQSPATITGGNAGSFTLAGAGEADVFVDFNGDGDWDEAGEKVCASLTLPGTCNFTAPALTATGNVVARMRARPVGSASLGPTGGGGDGEVEDHLVPISSNSRVVTVTMAGNGSGTVVSSPAGISCPGVCSMPFPDGANITLTATPATGTVSPVAWSDTVPASGDSGTCSGNTCTFNNLLANKAVTATFTLTTKTLTVAHVGQGDVTDTLPGGTIACGTSPGNTDCGETYDYGTNVLLHPVALPGWTFTGWSGDCTNNNGDCSLLVQGSDLSVTANFTESVHTLIVKPEAGSGTGSVTVTGITGNSPAVCTSNPCFFFPTDGDDLTFAQAADGDSIFQSWTDDCNGASCTLNNVSADHTVGADFDLTPDLRSVVTDDYTTLTDDNTPNAVTIVARVSNAGSVDPSGNATITSTLPSNVTIDTWDCASTGSTATTCGGATPTGNTGSVNLTVALPIGSELTFTFHGTAPANPPFGGIFTTMSVSDPDPEGAVVGLDNTGTGFFAYKRIFNYDAETGTTKLPWSDVTP